MLGSAYTNLHRLLFCLEGVYLCSVAQSHMDYLAVCVCVCVCVRVCMSGVCVCSQHIKHTCILCVITGQVG